MLKLLIGFLTASIIGIFIFAAVYVIIAAIYGRIFKLAGQPTLAAFIPVYNIYTFCKITFGSGLYFLIPVIASFIPGKLSSIIMSLFFIVSMYLLGKVFNKGLIFTLGLIIPVTSPIFILLLALSDSQYSGKASAF